MTYQPPTPPPPPPARSGGFDPKAVNPLDWGIIGAGVLAFIFSFISFFTYSSALGLSEETISATAWSGFVSLLAILLVIVGTAAAALDLFAPQVSLPVPARLVGVGAFALATVLLVINIFFVPNYLGFSGDGYDEGVDESHGFGFWATLILTVAALALSLMRFQATGGQLPGGLQGKVPNIGGYGPQDRPGAAPGVQGAGYAPPGAPPAAPPAPPAPPRPAPPTGEAPPPPPPGYTPPGQ